LAAAIEIRGVSKQFRLYHEHYTSLKERFIHFGRIPYEPFWALRDIDFDVEEGSTVGLLGHNGSGKSTLLKCVAGILQPTSGEIMTRGRVAALLELGAGFNHELTGRENIFMNASILGLSKKETEKIFDQIVAFAELEKFIDMQVRHYSSGMYVRLGFAVAVNVDPDILLVDEVLSVGDESFQRKCLDRVKLFQKEGRTILFVTHAADLVRQICDHAVVLDHGAIVTQSAPGEAVRVFRETLLHSGLVDVVPEEPDEEPSRADMSTYRIRITDVVFEHPGAAEGRTSLLPDEPLTVRVEFEANEETRDVQFGIMIHDQLGGSVFGSNTTNLGMPIDVHAGHGELSFVFARVPLLDGTYPVTVAVQSVDAGVVYDWHEQRYSFSVINPTRDLGTVSMPMTVELGDLRWPVVESAG
jgi:ABC-2 type transport system ATP-binding protein